MFFEDLTRIEHLAKSSGFSIFVLPKIPDIIAKTSDKNHLIITPDETNQIRIEQIREIIEQCHTKQTKPFYIFVFNAETMNEKAENAFLKLLEEPSENYHFALFTNSPSSLLPTILSRGEIYIQRIKNSLEQPIEAEESIKKYAKQIISANSSTLCTIVNNITKDKIYKKDSRNFILQIVDTAIEISYKSFFSTKNPLFLRKITKLLVLYDNLKQNGHIKLHLIADLC